MNLVPSFASDTADPYAPGPDPESEHRELARFNHWRLGPRLGSKDWRRDLAREHAGKLLEGHLIEALRAEVAPRAAQAPSDPDGFVGWFEALEAGGPGQHDPLFPWLADEAKREHLRWFLEQEVAGEAGFEDLLAFVQVKMPERAKLEMARNYWDEMGRGNPKGMHGPMLQRLAEYFGLKPDLETVVWQALALANTMVALATNPRFAFHAVGALGVVELTAPGRSQHVAAALRRLGVPAKRRHYFELHAVLDRAHSAAWNAEVLRGLVAEEPASAIAEGALMRLTCGARCFDRYRLELWAA